jgi:hypothetical protein
VALPERSAPSAHSGGDKLTRKAARRWLSGQSDTVLMWQADPAKIGHGKAHSVCVLGYVLGGELSGDRRLEAVSDKSNEITAILDDRTRASGKLDAETFARVARDCDPVVDPRTWQ